MLIQKRTSSITGFKERGETMVAIKQKMELLKLLVSVPFSMLSESEINIMCALADDGDIQEVLEKAKRNI
jgi:hypothetical protein